MYTGTATTDWSEVRARGAQAVQTAEAGLPWEHEQGPRTGNDQDTWLLSFIDVLTLLLTLFVLLLAYQRDQSTTAADVPETPVMASAATAGERAAPAELAAMNAPASAHESQTSASPTEAQSVLPATDLAPHAERVLPESTIRSASTFQSEDGASAPASVLAAAHPLLMLAGEFVPDNAPHTPADVIDDTGTEVSPETAALPETPSPAQETLQRLLTDLDRSALAGRIEVSVLPDAVNLEINDNVLFAPASAALTDGGRALLDELVATLTTLPYALSVEGHTDNVPIRTARYPSNWELATARASAVTRHLIDRGIAADRVRAIGYADTRPRADNGTEEGRARNRRVAFILRMPAAAAGMPATSVTR